MTKKFYYNDTLVETLDDVNHSSRIQNSGLFIKPLIASIANYTDGINLNITDSDSNIYSIPEGCVFFLEVSSATANDIISNTNSIYINNSNKRLALLSQ